MNLLYNTESIYSPMFVNVIKRKGKFFMTLQAYELEKETCFVRSGLLFDEWLKENGLCAIAVQDKTMYKIYTL